MLNAIRSARTRQAAHIGRITSGLRFRQTASGFNQPRKSDNMEMEQQAKKNSNPDDMMSQSSAENYATRSDEEGMGGAHGGNDPVPKVTRDRLIHENHPAFDKTTIENDAAEEEKPR
ncbi:hypothetical protein NMG60_11007989 [Bertholletia excelsa]